VSFKQVTGDSNLFTWDPSRNALTELTDDALSDLAPTVAADGGSVVFQRSRPSPVRVNPLADTSLFLGVLERGRFRSEPTALIDGHAPRLSPDGSRVAYLQKGPDRERATLFVKHLGSGETIQLSSTCPEPSYFLDLHEWADHNLAWSPSGTDLYFVDRPDVYVVRRYQVGAPLASAPLAVAQAGEIIHDLQPSTSGGLAYLVRSAGGSTLRFVDSQSGESLRTVPLQGTASARGWLTGDTGLVLARAGRFQTDFTSEVEALVVSTHGAIRSAGIVPDAFLVTTRLDPQRSVLYVVRIEEGAHNLYEISLVSGRVRRVTDNGLPGVTFSGIEPLGGGALIGVRYEQTSDIWLLDATPLAPESAVRSGS
jgi:hypothetical protein